jgi:hypothetical protein
MLDFCENVTEWGLTVYREFGVGVKFFEVEICKFESEFMYCISMRIG